MIPDLRIKRIAWYKILYDLKTLWLHKIVRITTMNEKTGQQILMGKIFSTGWGSVSIQNRVEMVGYAPNKLPAIERRLEATALHVPIFQSRIFHVPIWRCLEDLKRYHFGMLA